MFKRQWVLIIGLTLALAGGALHVTSHRAEASGDGRAAAAAPSAASQIDMPLAFVENRGQWGDSTKFALLNGSLAARFEPNAIRLHTAAGERAAAVGLVFEGASPRAQVSGEGEQAGRYNFFIGNDPARWRSGVPAFGSVLYRGLYRDIDLRVRESAGVLEYDLLLAAGADLSKVAVRADGAARLEVAADGSLLIHTAHGPLRQTPPTTWEELPNGERRPVVCRFRQLDARRYGFTVEGRDHSLPLVIDPGLEWATYLGGGGHEVIRDMAVARDGSGDIVLVGSTSSLDFPATGGSFNANGQASFVARLSASGSGVVYATLFGGSGATGNDFAAAVTLDAQGAPVVVGNTGSNDFPVTAGSYDGSYNGGGDAFVTRFDAAGGRLVFSTFLGGAKDDPSSRFYSSSGYDEATAVGFDPAGSIIVAGYTTASTFPATAGAYDTTPAPFSNATMASMQDGFVARLNADGSQLTYSTYLGGQAIDTFHDLAVDAGGVVSLVGYTVPLSNRDADGNELPLGTAFPATAGAYDTTYNGNGDAVLVRLNPAGGGASDLQYSTFLGGNDTDEAWAVALDPNDHTSVAVIGETFSGNFPVTASAFGKTHFMPGDATMVTVSRFRFPAAGGGSLAWSTYYGGPGFQSADDGFVDETGAVVVVGSNSTSSPPTTERAFDRTPEVSDGFVARVSADGTRLLYSTLLGGSSFEGNLRAVGLGNNAVAVAGQTKSIDFPVTPGAYDTIYSTSGSPSEFNVYDTFIARLTLAPAETGDVTAAAPSLVAPAASATFTAPAVVKFDWNDADDASGVEAYHIQVSPNATFADGNNARSSGWFEKWVPVSEASTDFSQSFVGTFYWRVQTLDRAHNLSAWSEVRTFTVGAPVRPAAPNLVYLANSARVPPARSITFMWDAADGATSYEIQIDDSSTFRAPLIAGRGGLTTTQFAQTFTRETSYWWRVRAVNAAGASPWSATRTFQVRRGASVPPPPQPPGAVTLSSLALNPSSLTGGASAQGTVTLSGAAPSGGALVTLSSSNAGVASVPASVNLAAGATSATFTVTTVGVNAATNVTITGSYGGATRTATLAVQPATTPPAAAALSSLALNPTSVTGGGASQGTVRLTAAAPSGGALVTLSSSSASASVPASVTVPAGATSAGFTVTTQAVSSSVTATITAAYGGATRAATLTVNAQAPPPATDTVAIQRAEYDSDKRELRVEATSSNASAVLRVYVASTGQLIGTLANNGGGRYGGQFSVSTNPQTVVVRSSLGGSATRAVTAN